MAATLTVILWRDIPAQVVAKDRRQSHKIVLHPRFQVAIDRAAVKADFKQFDRYIEQWRKVQRPCGDDLRAEAEAEVARLEAEFDRSTLNAFVAAGGARVNVFAPGPEDEPAAGTSGPAPA